MNKYTEHEKDNGDIEIYEEWKEYHFAGKPFNVKNKIGIIRPVIDPKTRKTTGYTALLSQGRGKKRFDMGTFARYGQAWNELMEAHL